MIRAIRNAAPAVKRRWRRGAPADTRAETRRGDIEVPDGDMLRDTGTHFTAHESGSARQRGHHVHGARLHAGMRPHGRRRHPVPGPNDSFLPPNARGGLRRRSKRATNGAEPKKLLDILVHVFVLVFCCCAGVCVHVLALDFFGTCPVLCCM